MLATVMAVVGDGLTLGDVVRDIPHDAAALFVYTLMLLFAFFIWYGSRNKQS